MDYYQLENSMRGPMQTVSIKRSPQDNREFLIEVLDVLDLGIEAFRNRRHSAWMIVSARLNQLLADKTQSNIPLAERVMKNLELHPLKSDLRHAQVDLTPLAERVMKNPDLRHAKVSFTGPMILSQSGVTFPCPFDLAQRRISVSEWLKQVFAVSGSVQITIGAMIWTFDNEIYISRSNS